MKRILFSKNFGTILCFSAMNRLVMHCIPISVTLIDNSAFSGGCNLESITVLFWSCSNLQSINVEWNNYSYTSIIGIPSKHQFSTFIIPTSVTSIADEAFSGCYNFWSITIPTIVTFINDNGFSFCHKLQSIVIPELLRTNVYFELFHHFSEPIKKTVFSFFLVINIKMFKCWR